MRVHWIWLHHRPGLSDRDKKTLLDHFRDPEAVYYADSEVFSHLSLRPEARDALCDKNLSSSEKILSLCMEKHISILTCQDALYPACLKNTADPPLVLYYKGQLPDFDANPVIAVVGTRRASAYGLTMAKRMGYQIAQGGGIVVSGLASGIDAMAMSGALSGGSMAVGVLGCGVDVVYPQRNAALYRDTQRYGCILSEFAPGDAPAGWHFPKRNRIISGLSNGVLVVEAPEKSGALITANLAAEQGRDVFAIPGNIDMPSFVGSNRLLRDGAMMVSSGWDILREYEGLYPDKIRRDESPSRQTLSPEEAGLAREAERVPEAKVAQKSIRPAGRENLKKELDHKAIDKEPKADYHDVNKSLPALNADEQAILNALAGSERLVDEVIAETGLSTGKLLAALTMLELKGMITRLPGKRIAPRGR